MVLSEHGYRMLGLDPEQAPTLDLWLAQAHPADRPALEAEIAASEAEGRVLRTVHRIRRRDDGAERWIETYGRHLRSGHGTRRLTGVSFDVTERRLSEERQTLLIREVDHRAKNVLAVVQAILRLTRADDPESSRRPSRAASRRWRARTSCWRATAGRAPACGALAGAGVGRRDRRRSRRLEGPDLQLRPERCSRSRWCSMSSSPTRSGTAPSRRRRARCASPGTLDP
jgi:PAS domain S-box-containing protein